MIVTGAEETFRLFVAKGIAVLFIFSRSLNFKRQDMSGLKWNQFKNVNTILIER